MTGISAPEDLLLDLAEELPIVIFEIDAEGVFLRSGGAGRRSVEDRALSPVGRSAFEIYHDAPSVVRNLRRALRGEAFVGRAEVPRDGAHPILFDVAHAPVFHPDGTLERVVGFAVDITAREIASRELLAAHGAIRRYAARLQTERETERARISRTIHDRIGQTLTALQFDAQWLRCQLTEAGEIDRSAVLARLDELDSMVEDAVGTVRNLAAELRPPVLGALGLVPALRNAATRFASRTGTACTFDSSLEAADQSALGIHRSTAAFRIVQEALTNVARHANACSVHIEIGAWCPAEPTEPRTLVLTVSDDGVGLSGRACTTPSTGLTGMTERAAEWGGSVTLSSGLSGGTVLRAEIPFSTPTPSPL